MMLAKIETAYLAVLRIVVLIAATLALVVAFGAAITSIPALSRQFGILPSDQAQSATLSDYIEARKATVPVKGQDGTSAAPATRAKPPAEVTDAAKILQSYSKGAGSMTIPLWEQEIEKSAQNIPTGLIDRYHGENLLLVRQLSNAKGKRLDAPGLKDMLSWNAAQFTFEAEKLEAIKAQETQRALYKMYVASIAFVMFILVVFTFLFVKVERSLRVVRTVRVGDTIHA